MLVNKKTQSHIDSFASKPNSSLMIVGSKNSGINTIVSDLSDSLLSNSHKNNVVKVSVEDKKNSIGVEQIRELKQHLSTKVGAKGIGRVAIVEDADKMTTEAQNGLLKLIEEPAQNTVVILMVHDISKLLDTIKSRCQMIKILPISKAEAEEYAKSKGTEQGEIKKLYTLSGGEAGLLEELLDNADSRTVQAVGEAKKFLSLSVFERLVLQSQYSKSTELRELLDSLGIISAAAMHSSARNRVSRWKDIITLVKACEKLIDSNTSAKLVFLKLSTNL